MTSTGNSTGEKAQLQRSGPSEPMTDREKMARAIAKADGVTWTDDRVTFASTDFRSAPERYRAMADAILSLKQGGGLKELADEMAQHQRRLANSERPSEVALWLDLNRVETHIRSFLAKPSDSGDAP